MTIDFFNFSEANKGAARWYAEKEMKNFSYCFVNYLDELNNDIVVVYKTGLEEQIYLKIKAMEEKDKERKYVYLTSKDIIALYEDMMDERNKVMDEIAETITPEEFFKAHILIDQIRGFIITSFEESEDKTEKYICAFNRDYKRLELGKTMSLAISMDGHYISSEKIEEKSNGAHRQYVATYCKYEKRNLVENIYIEDDIRRLVNLPRDIADLKYRIERALCVFEPYYELK